jgi:hypothetical protein
VRHEHLKLKNKKPLIGCGQILSGWDLKKS